MADSTSPATPGGPVNPTPSASAAGRAPRAANQPVGLETPGLVTFAGIMLFLLGGFELVWAIVEFFNVAWIKTTPYGDFGGHLWLWAILDIAFAVVALYAAYSIFMGGRFGQVFGIAVAGVSAIRWFFYLPSAPWVGIVMIAVDVLIIYGLVAHSDYFGSGESSPG